MIYAIYAACIAAILWGLRPVMLRKWRATVDQWDAAKPVSKWHETGPTLKLDMQGRPMNCGRATYGPLGETNVEYGKDDNA